MPSLEGHSRRKAILAILAASNKRNEQEQQKQSARKQHLPGVQMDKMIPRGNDKEPLPAYMQNNNGRIAMTTLTDHSLKANQFQTTKFLDPRSTFLAKTDFRVDPMKQAKKLRAAPEGKKKRSLTFNQLLAKYGYIEDESMTKKERKREWHVQKVRVDDSESSDDEFF
jgi:hypothetical protein